MSARASTTFMQSSKTPGISRTRAPLPRGWASCWGVTLPWGRITAEATWSPQVGGIEGRGGGGVAGGGADGEHLAGAGLLHQEVEVAQGRGHAPVLEGGAGVLAVVLEIEGGPDLGLKVGVGRHLGGVAFAQVDDVRERDHRGDEFVVPEDAAQGREVEHPAVVEEAAPEGPGVLGQARRRFCPPAGTSPRQWGQV